MFAQQQSWLNTAQQAMLNAAQPAINPTLSPVVAQNPYLGATLGAQGTIPQQIPFAAGFNTPMNQFAGISQVNPLPYLTQQANFQQCAGVNPVAGTTTSGIH